MQVLRCNQLSSLVFLANMKFNDDEQINGIQNGAAGCENEVTIGNGKVKIINVPDAQPEERKLKVLVELTGKGKPKERDGLDLVIVLDVSENMMNRQDRLEQQKKATEFVIKKLGPIDRVSVVTFSDVANRLCALRQISKGSKKDIFDLVNGVTYGDGANISEGLEMALRVLSGRKFVEGRSVGIILMSSGEQDGSRNAAEVEMGNVPVYTFAFGTENTLTMPQVLDAIARKSGIGGTLISDVQNTNDLRVAFANCFSGLLAVVVQDLKLIMSTGNMSTIENVYAGDHEQFRDDSTVSVMLGNLYDMETRKVLIHVLPPVTSLDGLQVLKVAYKYRKNGKELKSTPLHAIRKQVNNLTQEERKDLMLEVEYLERAQMTNEVGVLSDSKLPITDKIMNEESAILSSIASVRGYVDTKQNPAKSFDENHTNSFPADGDKAKDEDNVMDEINIQSSAIETRSSGDMENVHIVSTPCISRNQRKSEWSNKDHSNSWHTNEDNGMEETYTLSSQNSAREDAEKLPLLITPHAGTCQTQVESSNMDHINSCSTDEDNSKQETVTLSAVAAKDKDNVKEEEETITPSPRVAVRGSVNKPPLFSTSSVDTYLKQEEPFHKGNTSTLATDENNEKKQTNTLYSEVDAAVDVKQVASCSHMDTCTKQTEALGEAHNNSMPADKETVNEETTVPLSEVAANVDVEEMPLISAPRVETCEKQQESLHNDHTKSWPTNENVKKKVTTPSSEVKEGPTGDVEKLNICFTSFNNTYHSEAKSFGRDQRNPSPTNEDSGRKETITLSSENASIEGVENLSLLIAPHTDTYKKQAGSLNKEETHTPFEVPTEDNDSMEDEFIPNEEIAIKEEFTSEFTSRSDIEELPSANLFNKDYTDSLRTDKDNLKKEAIASCSKVAATGDMEKLPLPETLPDKDHTKLFTPNEDTVKAQNEEKVKVPKEKNVKEKMNTLTSEISPSRNMKELSSAESFSIDHFDSESSDKENVTKEAKTNSSEVVDKGDAPEIYFSPESSNTGHTNSLVSSDVNVKEDFTTLSSKVTPRRDTKSGPTNEDNHNNPLFADNDYMKEELTSEVTSRGEMEELPSTDPFNKDYTDSLQADQGNLKKEAIASSSKVAATRDMEKLPLPETLPDKDPTKLLAPNEETVKARNEEKVKAPKEENVKDKITKRTSEISPRRNMKEVSSAESFSINHFDSEHSDKGNEAITTSEVVAKGDDHANSSTTNVNSVMEETVGNVSKVSFESKRLATRVYKKTLLLLFYLPKLIFSITMYVMKNVRAPSSEVVALGDAEKPSSPESSSKDHNSSLGSNEGNVTEAIITQSSEVAQIAHLEELVPSIELSDNSSKRNHSKLSTPNADKVKEAPIADFSEVSHKSKCLPTRGIVHSSEAVPMGDTETFSLRDSSDKDHTNSSSLNEENVNEGFTVHSSKVSEKGQRFAPTEIEKFRGGLAGLSMSVVDKGQPSSRVLGPADIEKFPFSKSSYEDHTSSSVSNEQNVDEKTLEPNSKASSEPHHFSVRGHLEKFFSHWILRVRKEAIASSSEIVESGDVKKLPLPESSEKDHTNLLASNVDNVTQEINNLTPKVVPPIAMEEFRSIKSFGNINSISRDEDNVKKEAILPPLEVLAKSDPGKHSLCESSDKDNTDSSSVEENAKKEITAHSSIVSPKRQVFVPTEIKKFRERLAGFSTCVVAITQTIWRSLQEHGNTVSYLPPKSKTMKKAALLSVGLAMIFYILSGCFGNATFGDLAPGNLFTGFGFYNPFWLLDIAILCIEVLLVGAYQVYHQPLFEFVDKHGERILANNDFINKEYHIPLPTGFKPFKLNLFRLFWRTVFVIVITIILMLIPFFNDIVRILGAFGFWPLTVYFPVEMYVVRKKIPEWSSRWISLQILCVACLIISTAAAAGSFSAVVTNLKVYRPFQTSY